MKTICLLYLGICSQLVLLKAFGVINLGVIGWLILAPLLVWCMVWMGAFLRRI